MADRFARFIPRLCVVVVVGFVGFIFGAGAGAGPDPPTTPRPALYYPFPHHVPPHPGGVGFRFAMVHDVLHERFPKHGTAHYRERDRLTRQKLAALAPDDPAGFPLADDLGAGLERLGRSDDAVEVIRAKLARQKARGLTGRDLYTSYANLGTFLVHASFRKAVAGDPAARERFREGLTFVKQSVEVNPEAHFGREKWQAVIGEFVLAAVDDPGLLRRSDFVGNDLAFDVDPTQGRPVRYGYSYSAREHTDALREPDAVTDLTVRETIRGLITAVGGPIDRDRQPRPASWQPAAVAFDEPMLGIIGMWRQGGGANPHFALAIGETMLRVGQRYIAWAAFERAYRLSDRFWPDPAVRQFLRDHCRKRQARIEATLPPAEAAELRPRFDAELTHGEDYQLAYQGFEERKIAAGVPLADEHFFDEFHAGRAPIASPTGSEEWYAVLGVGMSAAFGRRVVNSLGWGLCGAGLAALLATGLVNWWASRRTTRAVDTPA